MEQLRKVILILLDSKIPAHLLRSTVIEMITILANSQTAEITPHEDISRGETQTPNGLALSPTMAAMCADDYVRTIEFLRGTHAAIIDIREQLPDRTARVLYVGCGPYATLAVPLMAIFSSNEVTFTLLDIHHESITSAKSIVNTLGLSKSVTNFEIQDASSYRVSPDLSPDIILIEIMQTGLESEPQVAITHHLLKQAPHATLVPEEVRIDLMMVDPSREFDTTALEKNLEPIQNDRILIGSVFVVNRETVSLWNRNHNRYLPASTVQIPDSLEQRYQPMLFTVIRTYKKQVLIGYDSGLTCPRPLSIEGGFQRGDTIQFCYELGRHPRLIGTVRPQL